jgi:iron complex outermembrane recepter protein
MKRTNALWLSFAGAGLSLAGASQSLAEEGATATQDTAGLEEVVVTAQRREESSQRVAIPMSVLSADNLADAGVTTAQDLTRLVPALSAYQGPTGVQASMRGVGNLTGNTYQEQAIAFSFDGVYIARVGNVGGNFFDLDRVEILKGPQGTLYGRNTNAGAINLIPKRPTLSGNSGEVELSGGNFSAYSAEGGLNVQMGDISALRLAAQRVSHDGYLDDGYNDQDETNARVSWLLQPSSDVSLVVVGSYSDRNGQGSAGVQVDRRDNFDGPASPSQQAIWASAGFNPIQANGDINGRQAGVHAQLDWTTNAGTLTLLPAYLDSSQHALHNAAGFPIQFDEDSTSKSAEMRFASLADGAFSYVVGAFYFDDQASFTLAADQTSFRVRNIVPDISTTSYAAFGEGKLKLTEALRLIGGLRYTKEDKSTSGLTATGFDVNFALAHGGPPPAFVPPCVYFTPAPVATVGNGGCYLAISNAITSNKTTWRAGLEYDLSDQSMLYATASTGFKAGGFYAAQDGVFKPEALTAFTLGSKNRLLDNRLQFNVEIYYWQYKDKQVSHLGPKVNGALDLVTENAGSATMYGVEPEVQFLITDNDQIEATVAYEHATYDSFSYLTVMPGPTGSGTCPTTPAGTLSAPPFSPLVRVDCGGFTIPNTPKWVATAAYERTMPLGNGGSLVGKLAWQYRSSRISGDEQVPAEHLPSYATGDALFGYHSPEDHWGLTAYVNNLTDKKSYGSSFFTGAAPSLTAPVGPVGPTTLLNPPRTYGVRLNVKF